MYRFALHREYITYNNIKKELEQGPLARDYYIIFIFSKY